MSPRPAIDPLVLNIRPDNSSPIPVIDEKLFAFDYEVSSNSRKAKTPMSYYTGCQLNMKIPPDQTSDEDAIREALLEKLPGVGIEFISSADARRPAVAEAFVPESHPMAGMRRQDFGSTEMKPAAGETLLGIASNVLDDFKV
jgi:hypothetical protein